MLGMRITNAFLKWRRIHFVLLKRYDQLYIKEIKFKLNIEYPFGPEI